MARQLRIEYPNAIYHVMARGNRRDDIVLDDVDREMFVRTMGEACAKTGWQVLAWVLMDNHYHWVLRTPEANLVAGMRWFQNTYTRRYNARHRKWGHLFGGRYKSILVDQDGSYLTALMDYVHLNPARAGIVTKRARAGILGYAWSSLAMGYGVLPAKRKRWMAVTEGLGYFGWSDTAGNRREFIARLEGRIKLEGEESGRSLPEGQSLQSTLHRGWYWGSQEFREKLTGLLKKPKNRTQRAHSAAQSHDTKRAEEILKAGAECFGLEKESLVLSARKTQAARVAVAWAIARQTSQKQAWIAERLGLRTGANVSQQIRRASKWLTEGPYPDRRFKEWSRLVKN